MKRNVAVKGLVGKHLTEKKKDFDWENQNKNCNMKMP
jgi:hypothetical protein